MQNLLNIISSLNDETRIKILRFINIHGTCCVCDLENSFNMIQSRLSRHLKILKDGGFLEVKRDGRWSYYSINKELDNFKYACLNEVMKVNIELPDLKKGCKNLEYIKNS